MNRFNGRLALLFYGEKYAFITVIALVLLTGSAYFRLGSWDGWSVDYFKAETYRDLHLAPHLISIQLIYHAYLAGLSILFFKDLKTWTWMIPWSSSLHLAFVYGGIIGLSALLFLGVNHQLSAQLDAIMPVLDYSQNLLSLALYTALLYSLIGILFKPVGVVIFYLGVALILLYPVDSIGFRELAFKATGLYDNHLDLTVTLNQLLGMMMVWSWVIIIRFKKTALF